MPTIALGLMGLLVCCASLYAQQRTIYGSGRIIEASLPARNFNRVDMAAFGDVHIKRGNQEALRIKVDDNLLQYFETKVVDGVLVIYLNTTTPLRPTQPVEFDLSVKELQEIRLSGTANIDAPDLEAEQFSVVVTGTGNVEMPDFDAKRLTVWIAGVGNVTTSGSVDEQDITLTGTSQYKAGTLTSTKAAIRISGIGNAELEVHDVLNVAISGMGTLHYRGHPRQVNKSVIGMGLIMAVD